MIHADGITFNFGRQSLLRGLSFTSPRGSLTGILGRNGVGKSTLLRILAGLENGFGGCISWNDEPLATVERSRRPAISAFMENSPPPDFPIGVNEFLSLVQQLPQFRDRGIPNPEFQRRMTLSLDLGAIASRDIRHLSSGEWQRAQLALALSQETPLIFLDEPLSAQDPGHAFHGLRLLRNLAGEGKTILMVLHDVNLAAAFCTHVLGLKEGRTHFFDSPADALRTESLNSLFDTDSYRSVAIPGGGTHFFQSSGN